MGKRIVAVGSINLDFVIRTPRFPSEGKTLLAGGIITVPGGKGAPGRVEMVMCSGICPNFNYWGKGKKK